VHSSRNRSPRSATSCALVLLVALALASERVQAQPPASAPPIFRFETDAFWLNLHHFLYVLGRHENRASDSQRDAVVRAPADAERGLARLSDDERAAWRDAVQFYKAGPSQKDLIFDSSATALTRALADAGARSLASVAIDLAHARVLERVAPLYRKSWWPEHRVANAAWSDAARTLVDRHGAAVLTLIRRAYGMPWPADGYRVHLSGYANWAGAYSTRANVLIVSTLDTAARGSAVLETLFHEAMHQWDREMNALLRDHARTEGKAVPRGLSHVLIFFTAGDAVGRTIPGHLPYADAHGIYDRGWQSLRAAVADIWKPYLDGRGTRDEALAALVRRTATETRP
jgi:hypothetical protein